MKYVIILAGLAMSCVFLACTPKQSTVYSFALENSTDDRAYGYYKFGTHIGTVGTLGRGSSAHEGFMPFPLNVKTEIVFTHLTTDDNEDVCATAEVDLQKYLPKGKQYEYVETIFRLEKNKIVTLSFEVTDKNKHSNIINVGKLPMITGNPKEWVDKLK